MTELEKATSYPQSCDACGHVFKPDTNTIAVNTMGIRGSRIRNIYHYPACFNHVDEPEPEGFIGYEWIYSGVKTEEEPQIDGNT